MKGLRIAILTALAALLGSCGGGTGGTGVTSNPGPTNALSVGVMTKGSVILNGVHYDDNSATISIDDTSKTAADLQSGMVVKVAGSINSDNVTGTAQQVRAIVEVRGTPDQVNVNANPPSLRVLKQMVFVDGQTIFSGVVDVSGITPNVTLIEVHGLRDSSGNIRATRIEVNPAQMADSNTNEIRGVVSNLNTNSNPVTFNLGSQAVSVASGATIIPATAQIASGSVVEVYCSVQPCISSGAFQASVIRIEEAADDAFQPKDGEQYEVEGLISGFAGAASPFFVAGTSVTLASTVTFEGGVVTDLGNDVQVEAEGSYNGATLVATKIAFKRSVIRLQGITANATANSFDMLIANSTITVTIQVDSFTTGTIPVDGTCVQVRGQRKLPATPVTVIAGEIDSCSGNNRDFIQAPVEAKIPVTSITLLGSPIDVSNPGDGFQGLNGPLTPTQFFDTITVSGVDANGIPQAGTLVKVTFNAGTNQIHEVEIEDEQ